MYTSVHLTVSPLSVPRGVHLVGNSLYVTLITCCEGFFFFFFLTMFFAVTHGILHNESSGEQLPNACSTSPNPFVL